MKNDDNHGDGLFLFYISLSFFIPLTNCKREHSRLLSITCHSLALGIWSLLLDDLEFFWPGFFVKYSRSLAFMIHACDRHQYVVAFVY